MRRCLPRFGSNHNQQGVDELVPSHLALAYDAWAPASASGDDAGKVPVDLKNNGQVVIAGYRAKWLEALENTTIDRDYLRAYERWKISLGNASCKPVALTSRLLVGHGNASATEVGLTVHHTWGVPMIPGSAIKGVCAHYVAATYGSEPNVESAKFRGPTWSDGKVTKPLGEFYRALFGAPEVGDQPGEGGAVTFHDALYVPGSANGKPFAIDVTTVHQRSYLGQMEGVGTPGERWPNDYDSPNPVGFLTVKKGTELLLAASAKDPLWSDLAFKLAAEAIREWGAGSKTSSGYGRVVEQT